MKGVDSLIVIAAIAIFMAGVVTGMVLMALAAAAKRNNERIERAEKHDLISLPRKRQLSFALFEYVI